MSCVEVAHTLYKLLLRPNELGIVLKLEHFDPLGPRVLIIGDFEYRSTVVHSVINHQTNSRKGKLNILRDVLNNRSGKR